MHGNLGVAAKGRGAAKGSPQLLELYAMCSAR